MKPAKSVFVCQECGAQSPKWLGRCTDCGAWNSLVEERVADTASAGKAENRYSQFGAGSSAKLYAEVENAHAATSNSESSAVKRNTLRPRPTNPRQTITAEHGEGATGAAR